MGFGKSEKVQNETRDDFSPKYVVFLNYYSWRSTHFLGSSPALVTNITFDSRNNFCTSSMSKTIHFFSIEKYVAPYIFSLLTDSPYSNYLQYKSSYIISNDDKNITESVRICSNSAGNRVVSMSFIGFIDMTNCFSQTSPRLSRRCVFTLHLPFRWGGLSPYIFTASLSRRSVQWIRRILAVCFASHEC